MFLSCVLGHHIVYHVIPCEDADRAWYWFFVFDALKGFWVALALVFATWNTDNRLYGMMALALCGEDALIQIADQAKKGDWGEAIFLLTAPVILAYFIFRLYNKIHASGIFRHRD